MRCPLTGNGHILLHYEPELIKRRNYPTIENYVKMKRMEFNRNGTKLDINDGHYQPSFIAANVDELSKNDDARKALRELKLLTVNEEEDKAKEVAEATAKKASEDKKSASSMKRDTNS